jgi:hypothetical protein
MPSAVGLCMECTHANGRSLGPSPVHQRRAPARRRSRSNLRRSESARRARHSLAPIWPSCVRAVRRRFCARPIAPLLAWSPRPVFYQVVRTGRVELPWPCGRWNLNPVRLPVPPRSRMRHNCSHYSFLAGIGHCPDACEINPAPSNARSGSRIEEAYAPVR